MKPANWLIKTESGKQLGPYSTEAVLKLIGEGTFSGLEMVRRYPDGPWIPFSKESGFYDRLLDALADQNLKLKNSVTKIKAIEQETVITNNHQDIETFVGKRPGENKPENQPQSPAEGHPGKRPESTAAEVRPPLVPTGTARIETGQDSKPEAQPKTRGAPTGKPKIRSRQILLPIFLLAVAGLILWLALDEPFSGSMGPDGRINLAAPRGTGSENLSATEAKQILQAAVSDFVKDTFESYIEAEKKLVKLIEGTRQHADSRGLLCLVYKELWPFSKQDSNDLDAISRITKSAHSVDPTGINSVYCDVVRLYTQARHKEARGVVEYALNQNQFSTAPILYLLKAELLSVEQDYRSAASYAEKAKQLWPEWIKSHFDYGRFLGASGNHDGAFGAYSQVINANGAHRAASLELGILLNEKMNKPDEALTVLNGAIKSSLVVTKLLESRAYYSLAQIYNNYGNTSKAKDFAKKAYAINPADVEYRMLLESLGGSTEVRKGANQAFELIFMGDQFVRNNQHLVAQAQYKAAFEIDSKNALAALKVAKSLYKLNQTQEALSWLQKAIAADPKLTQAYALYADYASEKYDFASAMQTLAKGNQNISNSHEIFTAFGLVELRRNNFKDALGYLQKSNKIYEHDVQNLILLAKVYLVTGDFQSAQRSSVKAIELDATDIDAQITYGRVMSQAQGFETGVMYIKDLVQKFAYTEEYRMALADLYKSQDRFKEAQQLYEQVSTYNSKNKKAQIGLGLSYQAQGVFDKALKCFLNATVLDPSDAEGLVKAGLLYMDSEKFEEAITQFKRALTINPAFPMVRHYVGKAAFAAGDYQMALDYAAEEKKQNPNIPDSYVLSAEIYTATKNFQKCASEYQQAIQLRPQGAGLYVRLARCHRQAGAADIAENMLNIAASIESGLPEIYREQGAIFEVKGDARAAAAAYSKYLALSPNAPDRKEIETRISNIGR